MCTYHEGYFMLILGLPPDGEDDGNAEDEKQHQEGQAPRFPPGDGLDSVRGQNTQAQHEEGCKGGAYAQHNQHPRFLQMPQFTQCILIRYRVLYIATWPNTQTLPFPRGQQGRISLTEATPLAYSRLSPPQKVNLPPARPPAFPAQVPPRLLLSQTLPRGLTGHCQGWILPFVQMGNGKPAHFELL